MRSCTVQIFILQNIIEQYIIWQSTIYHNLIDFQNAFDSIHRRKTGVEIPRLLGMLEKIIQVIQALYNDFTSVSFIKEISLVCCPSVSFIKGISLVCCTIGSQQGCMLSPLLFLTVLDWIMKEYKKG